MQEEVSIVESAIHRWDVTPKEAIAIQQAFAPKVRLRWDRRRRVKTVAGVDVSVRNGISRAAIVLLSFPQLVPFEAVTAEAPTGFPYVSGLLTFREGPIVLEAWSRLRTTPDLALFDGQGIAHPRRLGLASHLGLWLDLPTIGCAKSKLFGTHASPAGEKGSSAALLDPRTSEQIGHVLRSRSGVKPIYISPGHRIDLGMAEAFALACCMQYRLPETTRWAHRVSRGEAHLEAASRAETGG